MINCGEIMKKKILLYISVLFIFILLFSGCESPIESDQNDEPKDTSFIPEPGENTGVVFGYLFSSEGQILNESIFLTKDLAYDKPDLPVTIAFSYQSDLRGKVDEETGIFFFDNVEPAENYVIAILRGSGEPIFAMNENGDQPLVFQIKAGEQLDLGEIIIDIP
jgi:hypothetical protein